MEVILTIVVIAIFWLFAKSKNNNTNITKNSDDIEGLIEKIEFLQKSFKGLEKSRDEQQHKNYELIKQINDLESAQILNKYPVKEGVVSNYSSSKVNDAFDENVNNINTTSHNNQQDYDINSLVTNNNTKTNSVKLDLPEIKQFLQGQVPNPNFSTFIYNIEDHSPQFTLLYSHAFNQFLRQIQQTEQIHSLQSPQESQAPQILQKQGSKPKIQAIDSPIKPSTNSSTKSSTKPKLPPKPTIPSFVDKAFVFAKRWLTTGNIPVKIGMIVIICAVIALLRLATNMGLINVPIHVKLLGVVISALVALIFAWTKRHSKRSFSLSVQGGSIGIILLTIFSAVKMYTLMSPTAGFIISFCMVFLTAVLSIQQNAKVLALMAICTGFLAPIWLSDGSGSHVVLFSYYAILNVGIFILAIYRPWRELNVLGFVFTYIIGSAVGGLNYTPDKFSSIEPFVIIFFCFYLLIPLRYAQQANQLLDSWTNDDKNDDNKNDVYKKYNLNAGLLFGTPLVTLLLQVALLDSKIHLALSCVVMGIVYGVLAILLKDYRHKNDEENLFTTLQHAYTAFSVSFLTLAVPIGLSAKATTTIFALEGAGAIWLGATKTPHKRRILTWLAGGSLQLAAAVAFVVAFGNSDYGLHVEHTDSIAIFNELYLSGLLLAVSGLLCGWFGYRAVVQSEEEAEADNTNSSLAYSLLNTDTLLTNDTLRTAGRLFFLWGMTWWIGINIFEITRVIDIDNIEVMYGWIIFITATAVMLPVIYNHRKGYGDTVVWILASLLMMTGGLFTLIQWLNVVTGISEMPLVWVLISWSLFAIGGWLVWRGLQTVRSRLIDWSVAVWFLAITLTISTIVYHLLPHSGKIRETGWYWGIIFAVWMVVAILDIYRPQSIAWLANRPISVKVKSNSTKELEVNIWQTVVSWCVLAVLCFVFAIVTFVNGGDGWWVPLLNSADGLQIGLAFLILAWCIRHDFFAKVLVAYVVSLTMVISISVRMMEHWSNWNSNIDNLSDWNWLTIFGFWTIIGFGLWVLLTDRLLALSERLSDITLEVFQVLFNSIMMVLIVVWGIMLMQLGEVSPWLPVLNPLDGLQLSILLLVFLWDKGSEWQAELLDRSTNLLSAYVASLAMIICMSVRMLEHWANWQGNIQNISDWHWLSVFGFWTIIGFGLWALLTNRLSVISKKLSETTLKVCQILQNSIMFILLVAWFVALLESGEVSPWIPLLNPLAILQWIIVALLLLWAHGSTCQGELLDRSKRSLMMSCFVLILITVMTLRFVFHHSQGYQGGSFEWGPSMFSAPVVQMALTVVWTILGVIGWIVGSKRQSKPIWLLGAVLMAVLLIKLVFIDWGHLGNIYGIGSFVFYGILCTVIGYIAPMPTFSESSLEDDKDNQMS